MPNPEILPTGISRLAVNAVVITTVFSVVAVALSLVRFRLRERGTFGKDDWFLVASLVLLVAQLVGAYLRGEGWAMEDLLKHPERITWLLKLIYWPELGYYLIVVTIKTSILFSYLRIFGHVPTTKIHIWILLGLTWAWGIAFFFSGIFQCTPIKKAWEPQVPGHCIQLIPYLWGSGISNFVIDWLILIVPIGPVLKLHLPTTRKILVVGSFLCGALACIASTIRAAKTAEFDPNDIGISDYHASLWVYMEPPLAIISCCLPFLARLVGVKVVSGLKHITNRVTQATGNTSNSANDTSNGLPVYGVSQNHFRRDKSMDGFELLTEPHQNIHATTTTTVQSLPKSHLATSMV